MGNSKTNQRAENGKNWIRLINLILFFITLFKAAAGLCVGVGSFSDPKEVPGMAHFLEHMVFMGSEKFPEENDFDSFIKVIFWVELLVSKSSAPMCPELDIDTISFLERRW